MRQKIFYATTIKSPPSHLDILVVHYERPKNDVINMMDSERKCQL